MDQVPHNLEQAVQMLASDQQLVDHCANINDMEQFVCRSHHNVGRQIRNQWNMWGSDQYPLDLYKWGKDQGIHHADDLSTIVLNAFWCHVHNRPYLVIQMLHDIEMFNQHWSQFETPNR